MSAPTPNETTSTSNATIDTTNIEQLIYDIAEHARDGDYAQLYTSLTSQELFIPVEQDSSQPTPQQIKPGEAFSSQDAASLQIHNVEGPRGEAMVPVATQVSEPIAGTTPVGIYWLDALALVLKIETVAGILLQGKDSWICFYKPQIENILKTYGASAESAPGQA